ncbi:hypothetical protein [Bradyrhizobium sp. CSA207]|uniref:hypothetical protein n=1 Tax=Bradyrhizobium sp. CSA207 TaxID=2698826 RepID=UPI0023AF9E43|nr:hypothetical protein [Bradyrhizobium sp. CSA207]
MFNVLIADRAATHPALASRTKLALLGLSYLAVYCISLIVVVNYYSGYLRIAANDTHRVLAATITVIPFALCSVAFAFTRCSFGYAVGFYFYTLITGYLWLVNFSTFPYDHLMAWISAFASGLAFLAPALMMGAPIRQRFVLTPEAFRKLPSIILIGTVAIVAIGSFYNFRFVGLEEIYQFRSEIGFPKLLEYAIGITSGALLPFAFACFVWFRMRVRAGMCLVLLAVFWPITLSKASLFAPAWLMFLAVLTRFFEARVAVVLSLFLPVLAGIVAAACNVSGLLSYHWFITYFSSVNFRMLALTSSALDFYNDYFSTHGPTYFCQLSPVRLFVSCSIREPLSVAMQNAYQIGYFNASLFASEGIASVGMKLAPLSALGCGILIGFVNRVSAGLPASFILLSGGLLLNTLLNVPLSTALATHGAALLFLLWYVTPRSLFAEPDSMTGFEAGGEPFTTSDQDRSVDPQYAS